MIKVDDIELPKTEILLVDAPDWDSLLVGEDLLQAVGMSVQAAASSEHDTTRQN